MEKTFRNYLLYTLIGLASSGLMDIMSRMEFAYVAPYLFITSFSFIFALAFDDKSMRRLVISSSIAAFIITFPFLAIHLKKTVNGFGNINSHYLNFVFFSLPSFAFMVHCFHYAYHKTDHYQLNYRYLFEGVWNTIPMLILAGIFANIANGLIIFASMGFKTVNSYFLENYYTKNGDALFILNSMFFFIGLSIAKTHEKITLNLRFVLLRMLNVLFPLLILTTFIYVIMFLSFHGREVFTMQDIDGTPILLSFSVLGIIFFNAYYQDGNQESPLSPALTIIFKIYLVLLFVMTSYSSLQIYVSYHRELPTGVNLYLVLLVLFALAYALSVCFKGTMEKRIITAGNMLVALAYLMSLLIMYHPFQSYRDTPVVMIKSDTVKTNKPSQKKAPVANKPSNKK